ncbi:CPCC family cysteine-rich protein [Actinosynnema sp. NPDC023794]
MSELPPDYEISDPETGLIACPCCGYATLGERHGWEICDICFWEDDGQDDHNADLRSPPNDGLTLIEARENFARIGACNQRCTKFVRPPRPDERRLR